MMLCELTHGQMLSTDACVSLEVYAFDALQVGFGAKLRSLCKAVRISGIAFAFACPRAAESWQGLLASHPAACAGIGPTRQKVCRYPPSSAAGRHAVASLFGVGLCIAMDPGLRSPSGSSYSDGL